MTKENTPATAVKITRKRKSVPAGKERVTLVLKKVTIERITEMAEDEHRPFDYQVEMILDQWCARNGDALTGSSSPTE